MVKATTKDRRTFPVEKTSGRGAQRLLQVRPQPRPKVPQHPTRRCGTDRGKTPGIWRRGTDQTRTLLLVWFLALLVNFLTAAAASAQPLQELTLLSSGEMPPKHALTLCKQTVLRFWDLTAQRGWARLILDHFHDLLLSPGSPSAAAQEPGSVSREHHTFFS